jgi:transposase
MARVSIRLSDAIGSILREIIHSSLFGSAIVRRARCIELAFEGESYSSIHSMVGLSIKTISKWVRRFEVSIPAFGPVEQAGVKAALMRCVLDCFRDAPRSGAPKKFCAEHVASIISIACEDPVASNRPVTSWTVREIADESVARKIVDSISESQVRRFLNDVQLRPQDNKGWCFTTEKDQELFQEQAKGVCDAYLDAPRLLVEEDVCTVCVDEMTSLQANEKRAPTKRPIPGHCGKEECQYTRHGTVCLTGNWDVVRGQFLLPTIEETRNNEDFSQHIERLIQTDLATGWVFVVDNLNTHCGEPLVRMVAGKLGIPDSELGEVAKKGVLKDMASRRAFLSDNSHLVRFVYIPKHSSWLNQIEAIFGMFNRRVMRGGSFKSKEDLMEKLREFAKYFNETIAKPMKWTFTGRPTEKETIECPKTWREMWPFRHLKTLLQKPEGTSGF